MVSSKIPNQVRTIFFLVCSAFSVILLYPRAYMCICNVSSQIRMEVGVGVIVIHVLHWVKIDLEMTLDAYRGLRTGQNWACTREDTVLSLSSMLEFLNLGVTSIFETILPCDKYKLEAWFRGFQWQRHTVNLQLWSSVDRQYIQGTLRKVWSFPPFLSNLRKIWLQSLIKIDSGRRGLPEFSSYAIWL